MVELIHTHKGTVYAQQNGVLIPVNTDGLVGYWPMTEGSGTTLYDESKNGNTGTIYGAVWVDTPNGEALDFDGVDDGVDIPNDFGIFDGTQDFSITGWFNPDDVTTTTQRIIGFRGENSVRVEIRNPDKVAFLIYDQTANQVIEGSIATANWYHFVGVYNDSVPEMEFFLNGISQGTLGTSGDINTARQDNIIGGGVGEGNPFDGKIDEVRVYDRALSAQEITNTYEKTRGLYNV